jgi:hypothetical protein
MSSKTNVAGARSRPIASACSIRLSPCPVSRILVRPGIAWSRYVTDSVLPVPGGPFGPVIAASPV